MFSARLKAEEEPGNAVGVNVEVQKRRKIFTREIVPLMVNIYIYLKNVGLGKSAVGKHSDNSRNSEFS